MKILSFTDRNSRPLFSDDYTVGTRRASSHDMSMLLHHRNHPEVRRWLGSDGEISMEQHVAFWASPAARLYRIATWGLDDADIGLIRITLGDHYGGACVGADVFAHKQGSGHGHRVFGRACELAAELGAKRLWLKVFLQNTKAVKIYLRAGFEFTGEMETMWRTTSDGRTSLLRYATMEKKLP